MNEHDTGGRYDLDQREHIPESRIYYDDTGGNGGEPVKYTDDESVFFDERDLESLSSGRKKRGSGLPVAAFIVSIVGMVFLTGGFVWTMSGFCIASAIMAAAAIGRKHTNIGFAYGALILSGLMLALAFTSVIPYPGTGYKEDRIEAQVPDSYSEDPGIYSPQDTPQQL
ncbi:MAG: hypothetical protein IJ874_08500 [Ruminococcus sp.]|nr:hypothetical protein [Ruminococcus sp.]